jgi:hypothetical protein
MKNMFGISDVALSGLRGTTTLLFNRLHSMLMIKPFQGSAVSQKKITIGQDSML